MPFSSKRLLLICSKHTASWRLAYAVAGLMAIPLHTAAQEVAFDAGFLRTMPGRAIGAGEQALKLLQQSALPPGRYDVTVLVNLEPVGRHTLDFHADSEGKLQPCLAPTLLAEWGLRLEALQDGEAVQKTCLQLPRAVPGAQLDFKPERLRLAISIPQIAMRRAADGSSDPSRWDSGINAAFINYTVSTLRMHHRQQGHHSNDDLYLDSGINLGDWRLRTSQSWRQDSDGNRSWTRTRTYAQRDLPGTRANLTIGESFTDSDIFSGVPITGLQVASDLGMLTDTQQGYAPVIRGVAQTRAKLEVWQNGYPIYSTYVSPGPYAIDDLNVAGNGELEVVVTEADGQVRRFVQPYASLGNLLRPGVWRYNATIGRYNPAARHDKPMLAQATFSTGMEWDLTLYGGLMLSDHYRAANLGIGKNLGNLGAVALDMTHADSQIDAADQTEAQGQSYAFKYGKSFDFGTNLRFAGYRYSTQGYRDFSEAVRQRSQPGNFQGSRRSRLEASVYQRLGQRHSLNLSFSQQDYWQRNSTQRQYQLSFNTYHAGLTYNLFASQSLTDNYGSDRQFGLSVSMPLDFGRSANATLDWQKQRQGYSQRAGLSGTADDGQLSYNASLSQNERHQRSGALALGYQGAYGSVGTGISQGTDYRSVSLNASGAMLWHAQGVEFGTWIGDTAGLVEVPGVAGVGVQNSASATTNARGYTIVPSLQPYRYNTLLLQTDTLGPDVQIDNGTARVIPRRGAIVKSTFDARTITRLVLTLRHADGSPLPFGALVLDTKGEQLGLIGQAGQAAMETTLRAQTLTLRWGKRGDQQCQVELDPAALQLNQGYYLQDLTCSQPAFEEAT
ncbi:fimbria/pilus outer membrane usher protein [Pseudomonas sp.]|uniref:fimbria/pilus outer membrane usher protein n=1 Tax=Pseudomonas sp. TaxID=306 RepID=UPI0028AB1398|nr:fimbria/pilus outer membrane usher protein [Pseudomonas sp.]